jgi:hypothetical protein
MNARHFFRRCVPTIFRKQGSVNMENEHARIRTRWRQSEVVGEKKSDKMSAVIFLPKQLLHACSATWMGAPNRRRSPGEVDEAGAGCAPRSVQCGPGFDRRQRASIAGRGDHGRDCSIKATT